MTFHTVRIVLSLSAAAAAAILVGGCADKSMSPVVTNDRFEADDAPRRVDAVFAQQHAVADREDGTFYSQHFTNGKLNSLGYQKLSSMAYGPGNETLAIYVDLPAGDKYDAASGSLTAALTRGGIAADRFSITQGANPAVSGTAVAGLGGLARQHAPDNATGPDSAAPGTAGVPK